MHRTRRVRWAVVLAGALLTAFFFQELFVSRMKSVSVDEPAHIAGGVSHVQLRVLTVNPQHPPLLKALSALALTLAGARWPETQQARALAGGEASFQWVVGGQILQATGVDRALSWARLPMILVATLGGLMLYLWGRRIAGDLPALGALFLYTLDPNILGHGYLVTLDVGLAAFTTLFLFCLWRYTRLPSRSSLVFCGLTLGCALCTKFSATFLFPIAALLLVPHAKPAVVTAAPDEFCPCGSGRKYKDCHASPKAGFDLRFSLPALVPLLWMGLIAVVTVWAIYLFHNPTPYLTGMGKVYADKVPDHLAYLAGRMDTRFLSYFTVAYLLKEPLAYIALAAIGFAVLCRSRKFALGDALFLIVPMAILFLAHVWKAENIGVRYIIPCLPFAHLLGGIALAYLWDSGSVAKRCACGILCGWAIVAAAGIYPDHTSYFNEAACVLDEPSQLGLDGGSRCGIDWLDDSNVDWGTGYKALKEWLRRHEGPTIRMAPVSHFPPEAYGIAYERLEPLDLVSPPKPGRYVVSAHAVAYNTGLVHKYGEGVDWLRSTKPSAIIAHSLYVYDIPAR